jgi:hypothetical protein
MAPQSRLAQSFFLQRSTRALVAGLSVGAMALVFPPLALLAATLLGLTAALRAPQSDFDWTRLAGPTFAALIVGAFTGLAGAVGVLFAWRLFADTRWSMLEEARLNLAAGRPKQSWWGIIHAWASPIFGLAVVAYTSPHMVAGLPLDLPHVPMIVVLVAGVIAGLGLFDWLLRVAADWRLGEVAPALAAHQGAHHALFLIAYGAMIDVSAGLLSLIAWRLAHAALQPAPTLVRA